MANQSHNLVFAHVNGNSLEHWHVSLARVSELDVLENHAAVGSLILGVVRSLSTLADDLVRRHNQESDLVTGAKDLGDGLNVVCHRPCVIHDRADVEHDTSDLSNGKSELIKGLADDEDDQKITA